MNKRQEAQISYKTLLKELYAMTRKAWTPEHEEFADEVVDLIIDAAKEEILRDLGAYQNGEYA